MAEKVSSPLRSIFTEFPVVRRALALFESRRDVFCSGAPDMTSPLLPADGGVPSCRMRRFFLFSLRK